MAPRGSQDSNAELQRARNVQLSMLPQIPAIDTLEIAAHYRPCDLLGGDFYDFIKIDAWRLGIVVADVSGHGAAAALLMAVAKKVLQLCGRGNTSPRQALLEVNDSIRADIPTGMFLSALYGVLDIRNHRLALASCGHNPPLWRRGDKVLEIVSKHNAPVLGVMPSDQLRGYLREEYVQLEPDDVLVFYTDGITETFNPERAMYGAKRLRKHVRGAERTPGELVNSICADVDAFRNNAALTDDETLVVIRVGRQQQKAQPLSGPSSVTNDLPMYALPLLGRAEEVSTIAETLKSIEKPVLTITGPAGAGKTRLAIAAADAARDYFPGGMHYVDLRRASGTMDVCREVARVMRLGDDETRLGLRIAMALQNPAGRTLLLLDNCEACAGAVQRCIEEWRSRTDNLQVLATSRVATEAERESCISLAPMASPRAATSLTAEHAARRYPVIQLFAQRAQQADPEFRLTDENLRDVAAICAQLDCLPQAVELAAARVDLLSPRQIAEGLDRRLDLLADGEDTERSTLSGTLSLSWDMLSGDERAALMRVSQFPAGFQRQVALDTLAGLGAAPDALLGAMLKHSLLHENEPDELEGEKRLHVYESFRLFALRNLEREPDGDARECFETALLNYVLELWKRDQEVGSQSARERIQFELPALLEIVSATTVPENRAWATVLAAPVLHAKGEKARALDMLREALDGINRGGSEYTWLRLTEGALRVQDAPDQVAALLEHVDGDDDVRFNALHTRASALHALGRTDEAIELVHKASKISGLSRSKHAMLKSRLGVLFADTGRTQEARNLFETALQLARSEDDRLLAGRTLFNLGWLNLSSDKAGDAVRQLTEALEIAEYEGDRTLEATAVGGLALGLHLKGEKQEAEACALRGIRMCRELGRSLTECAQLNTLSRIYHEQGRNREALQTALRARDLAREIGSRRSEALAESNIAGLRVELGEDANALQAWQSSYSMLSELNDRRGALSSLGSIGALQARQWKASGNPRDLRLAIDTLTQAVKGRREHGYDPLIELEITYAELLIAANRHEDARNVLVSTLATAAERADELGRGIGEQAATMLNSLRTTPVRQSPRPVVSSPPRAGTRTGTAPKLLTPPPIGAAPRPSSGELAAVPPKKSSSDRLTAQGKPTAALPPLKPKGPPGAAPRRRPRGFR